MIIGFNTRMKVYKNLSWENAKTALRMMKGLFKQGFNPQISKLEQDVIEFSYKTNASDITQKFDFAKRILTQNTRWEQTIDSQIHSGHMLNILGF